MSLNNIPFSKHNTFPSATKAWQRIAWFAATYGGELDRHFYNALMAQEQCPDAIAELQAVGVQFTYRNCRHWAIDCCGAFEVTHPKYSPPAGYDLPAANVLYLTFQQLFAE